MEELELADAAIEAGVAGAQVKCDDIPKGKYFLALSLCSSKNLVHLKSVKFPTNQSSVRPSVDMQ